MNFEEPNPAKHVCVFAYYRSWLNGKMVRLNEKNYGCGGCGTWWFDRQTRTREEYIDFLANEEGLKDVEELMGDWLDKIKRYQPKRKYLFVGPLVPEVYEYLETITFFVNPDQLSVLVAGAQYYNSPFDPTPVLAEFGSGCMEMLTLISGYKEPKAIIGSTDMAMRQYIPHDSIAFTVNKPMFEQLCSLDNSSFLDKPFLQRLKKSRGGSLRR